MKPYRPPRFRVGAIRELCESRRLNQSDIARTCGVTRQTISLWVCGRCQPMYSTILALCSGLGLEPTFFAEGLGERPERTAASPPLPAGREERARRAVV